MEIERVVDLARSVLGQKVDATNWSWNPPKVFAAVPIEEMIEVLIRPYPDQQWQIYTKNGQLSVLLGLYDKKNRPYNGTGVGFAFKGETTSKSKLKLVRWLEALHRERAI